MREEVRHGGVQQDVAALQLRDLHGWYGESHVLHGMALALYPGEVIALLGRNGAGKTTALRAIMGVLERRAGSVLVDGYETIGLPTRQIARLGVAYCPEERGIYSSLNVAENLRLPPVIKPGGLSEDAIFDLFPNLRARLRSQGTKLSGGEQQMLAIARILRTGSRTLLLDEPTEGLAPIIIDQIAVTIRKLKAMQFNIVLVEQNLRFASEIADRHFVVEQGRVVDEISCGEFVSSRSKLNKYLGV
ncbi:MULTISPECIES: ABC transporter ATP-binding protein [unclassified Chelatococcus]|uniref:ABC transporter ATP-binding protein n=1 Tax=unclassified Chelatococcus TaxID=2638111 RepID=UPI001BD13AE0|nr:MULTISPECIES: ABC transporter ATP-binding protein [unclassified Chelatococcus]CAH1655732.1 Histidinol dehydrogenase [Hyphomicrobiales bacterium]MBS7742565.1 ABC transporter ATP-binding protein [Chelatococcus sp. HY11]MBX3542317.1 ABC transporter ATP-binding protein [Chelatococcus sp.]MCO5075465.1 ABC transporter ATP-binding protein [Chelatococcus sp.]CAH1695617.1 Histidinol dehydrogenase [Hyphomicrobiales bacterium]